ncbi:MAG: metallophosphoesterase [Bacteroidota bacterium]|nr:metallophosphoesterase [Bacteroidota bacterium]
MAIFLTVVLTVYILVNLWLWFKGRRALSGAGINTTLYSAIFVALASTFVIGKFLEHSYSNLFTDIVNVIGGFWMGFMLYGFLAWLTADILLLLQKPFHLVPAAVMPKLRLWIFAGITSGTVLLIIIGFLNAISPVTKRYTIETAKNFSSGSEPLKIVAVSDIHLGSIIRKRSMRHLSEMISDEKPDLVLFLGDLLDGSIGPVLRGDLLSWLSIPAPRYGMYAITGNHEFMSDLGRSIPYIESKGIRVLKDEVVRLDNGVQLIGRIDRTALHTPGSSRKPLEKLLAQADTTAPVILLDHQPYDLSALAGTPVDMQLSGHTHNGQMWPLNLITEKMFELSHGYRVFGRTHVIVSSGFGIWGPRMRIGTRPEILSITLKGKSE